MHTVEQLGLLKMDFLGLRNLSIVDRTIELIGDKNLDIDNLDLQDDKTFKLFSEGRMTGVFQLESRVAQSVSRSLNPKRFEDIVALVALIRPGPLGAGMHNEFTDRANSRKEIEYLTELLKDKAMSCPKCDSTDVKVARGKVGMVALGVVFLPLAALAPKSKMKCKACGSRWQNPF